MALLSRDDILNADDVQFEEVPVPEWAPKGAPNPASYKLRLKSMTGKQRDAFEASTVETKGGKQKQNLENLRARLISRCAVNDSGELMFSPPDIAPLGTRNAAALDRVFEKCREMNGLTEKDVEDLTEGFEDDPSESSTSG